MIQSRITAKSQTTVPQSVRRALGVGPGDEIAWQIDGDRVVLMRVAEDDAMITNLATFTEWADEYDSVFDDL